MRKGLFAVVCICLTGFIAACALCVHVLLIQPISVFSKAEMRIVLDAGHGGIDGGVSGKKTKVKESDLNLSISHLLAERLRDMGFEITLTRKTEAGLYDVATKGFKKRDMQRRKEIIESVKPTMVVSIHQNYYPSSMTRGAQVFYRRDGENSKFLAACIQERLNEAYSKHRVKGRSIAWGEYYMLECTSYPSVIVECGFLSNEKDEALLMTRAWQGKIADSIVGGVLTYLENRHGSL
jgi:N-acetylmuramoyl-L-alanine amidase